MKPKPQETFSAEPAEAVSPEPRWFEALLAWDLGWLGRIFTGKL